MIVVDTKKNVYDVRFYDTNGVEWSEDFFNAGTWNTVELNSLDVYECGTDINALIDYMNDFLNKEGDFIDDETDVYNAFYGIVYINNL